ncbi:MAG: UDP-N-acetyl-D-mannosamine dehydrogenase [Gallionellales bacterium 35-53-114]|jgi:UDP-N-acetyl-D-mannosaminuronic acid dehydrogenase|nr:MAG: UDP-N-acetyl-D-mannosamine dehydrogenase [Gallionellales bacterium 35-53-114]OYZ63420.1 MAG: UDP-N-acetyl-D-mannosamine dehydrogenase [Gallionellales bacterium 24-53-125]OZB10967.1 MAG: UDP-N-acetyl-D-mannosamine dehydrogenase [Gallionellales bacterium 39-52-133]HQS58849.1 UDP-N-acetyl-D-mannosamine dehydrogenase [Gallionellaceae bacterium]HQS75766.1 UDP-N-acetyl-D-mannosamine dehydrogenase [Gallionellaceae bacterium]
MQQDKKICVIGLGYIGLPTGALLANAGYSVHGVDVSQHAVDVINQGKIHIVEPDLDTFVHSAVGSGRLRASTIPAEADIFMICVPTPFMHDDNPIPQPDLSYVEAAAKSIAQYVRPNNIVILESTSPVGTTELVRDTLSQCGIDVSAIHFSYCPERVLPGRIMIELIENDRIVGGLTAAATDVTAAFYRTFVQGEVLKTDSRTAEMCKLVENSSRDVGIAFANELSILCDGLGIDVNELIRFANRHPRVNILQPGCGVGGHCIAVDPWFIVAKDPKNANLIRAAREVNNYKNKWVVEKVKNAALKFQIDNGRPARIACMGLAFKPDIDDLRESPALAVAESLRDAGFDVVAVEPNIASYKGLKLVSVSEGIKDSDIVVFLVKHSQFVSLNIHGKQMLDFCGVTTLA